MTVAQGAASGASGTLGKSDLCFHKPVLTGGREAGADVLSSVKTGSDLLMLLPPRAALRLPWPKFSRLQRRLLHVFNPTFYSLSCSTSLQHAARFEAAMVTGVSGSLFLVWCLIMV
jgi:hypothetical protein